MRITSAVAATPAKSAIQPALRPMSSTTMTRLWASAVECSRPMASVAVATAVWKPNVTWVAARSLSIVLGTPTTESPFSANCEAMVNEPSPPMAIRASNARPWNCSMISSERSTSSTEPSDRLVGHLNGFPRFVVPRIVPPRCVSPRTESAVRGTTPSSSKRPSYPRGGYRARPSPG